MKTKKINISLLYAEDEQDTRKNISDILSRRINNFYVVKNGSEALEIYKKHQPELVLTDIQMPGMNGLQLAGKIKQINPKAKIIMMTAFTDTDFLLKAIKLQVEGFIVKPVIKQNLLSTIQKQADSILLEKKTKKQEQELFKSEAKYRQLFDYLPYGGEVLDTNGIIIECSPATSRMLGYETNELIGKHITNFIDTETVAVFKQNFPKLIEGESFMLEICMIHKNGTKIHVLRAVQSICNNNGEVDSILALNINITDRKKAEEAIRKQNIELQERNAELDAFSHTVAHDLKNPIGNILGFAELLLDRYPTLTKKETEKYINTIIDSSNKTQQIINSLLLFASVRKEEISIDELNMDEIVAGAIKRFELQIKKTKAKISLPGSYPSVSGFSTWVEEVWANFISNAIKYGGSPPLVEIGFDNEESDSTLKGMIRFWVRDNGPGITMENQKVIFKKFERLDQADTRGHGLGLSIAQRIVKKLGGEVGLESKQGEGSLFYFTLPINTKISNMKPETPNMKPNNIKPSNLKILIVEDEQTSDDLLTIIMQSHSKEILHTKNGKETIELCRNNPDIDLILMDIRMPIMSGYEATRKIRKFNKDVIIIAQTAFALPGDREKAIAAGCDDYISKPIVKDELMEMIKSYKF